MLQNRDMELADKEEQLDEAKENEVAQQEEKEALSQSVPKVGAIAPAGAGRWTDNKEMEKL